MNSNISNNGSSDMQSECKEILSLDNSILNFNPNIDWVNSDVLHNANINERLSSFFDALQGREVTIIGSLHLMRFDRFYFDFIEVNSRNCWLNYHETLAQLTPTKTNHVYLFCASMMSNVLIDDLYSPENSYIDLGSALDPFCGVNSRSYHLKL